MIGEVNLAADLSSKSGWYYGYRIKDGSTPSALNVTWKTDKYAPDGTHPCHSTFVVKARWRGIRKGGDPNYGQWPDTFKTTTLQASSCLLRRDGDGAVWKADVTQLLPASPAYRGASWAYSARLYDEIEIELSIYATYDSAHYDWDEGRSPAETAKLYIGYFPDYVITSVARGGADEVLIEYTASGWTRSDDRYEVLSITSGGESLINPLWGNGSYSIGSLGHITLPGGLFKRVPDVGETISLSVRWNAAYKPPGLQFAGYSGTFTVGGVEDAERIVYDYSEAQGTVEVQAQDTTYDEVTVSVVGEHWAFDSMVAETSEGEAAALLAFPPLGVDFTVSVTGHKVITEGGISYDAQSPTETFTAHVDPESAYWVDFIDPDTGEPEGPAFKVLCDARWDVSYANECEIRKFSGRERPSAMYGIGGAKRIRLDGKLAPYPAKTESVMADLPRLYAGRVAVMRSPRGERYICALTSVSHSREAGDVFTNVSIDAEEVSL